MYYLFSLFNYLSSIHVLTHPSIFFSHSSVFAPSAHSPMFFLFLSGIIMYLSVSIFLHILSFSDWVSAPVSFCLSVISLHFQSINIIMYVLCIHLYTYAYMFCLYFFIHPFIHTPIHDFYIPISFYEPAKYFSFFSLHLSLFLLLSLFLSSTVISLSLSFLSLSFFIQHASHPSILGISLTLAQGQEMSHMCQMCISC